VVKKEHAILTQIVGVTPGEWWHRQNSNEYYACIQCCDVIEWLLIELSSVTLPKL